MFPLWEAPGREGRAWDGHRLLPVQVPKRGAMTYNLHWQDFLRIAAALKPARYNIGALLRDVDSSEVYPVGDALVLPFRHVETLQRFTDEMEEPQARQALVMIVSQAFGKPMILRAMLNRADAP